MPYPSADLSDLAEQFFGQESATDLSDVGPYAQMLRETVTHSEWRTRPYVASVFWQAFLFTPTWRSFLERIRHDQPSLSIRLLQVVPHGKPHFGPGRFDLLVLADGLAEQDLYIRADATASDQDLKEGSRNFLQAIVREGVRFETFDKIDHGSLAIEALHAQPFGILVMPAPSMVPTAGVPTEPIRVHDRGKGLQSTVGVCCVNRNGQLGVTASGHAVSSSIGSAADVGGVRARVASHHLLSDSAFIEVALPSTHRHQAVHYLTNLVPRQHEPVAFVGCHSGSCIGQVTGWSPQLPAVTGNSQLVVTTGPISAVGDSGAALRDGEGTVLGFCHEVSGFGAVNPYSSWIWAESVFRAHGLS